MPYVDEVARRRLADPARTPHNAGELNYRITQAVVQYLVFYGTSYMTINDIMGALSGAKAEFYRRIAVPYEDRKAAENGNVYPE